ncbi:MAG: DUF2207 domain-containing protein [Firmicutes bacterium]|nr:DUF2207 domain-containing protein [Bacillota bacterium]
MSNRVKFIIFGVVAFMVLAPGIIFAIVTLVISPSYARVISQKWEATLDSDGSLLITERLVWDVHARADNPNTVGGTNFFYLYREMHEAEVWLPNGSFAVLSEFEVYSVRRISVNGYYGDAIHERDGMPFTFELGRAERLYGTPRWVNYGYPWGWFNYGGNGFNTDFVVRTTAAQDLSTPGLGPNRWYHDGGRNEQGGYAWQCLFIYVDGLYRGKYEFEITYRMTNAVTLWQDCAELYVYLWSGPTSRFLESVDARLHIPNAQMPTNYNFFTAGTTNHNPPFTKTTDANYTTFRLNLSGRDLRFRQYNRYIGFALVGYASDTQNAHLLAPDGNTTIIDRFGQQVAGGNTQHLQQAMHSHILDEWARYNRLPRLFFWIKIAVLVGVIIIVALIWFIIWRVFQSKKKRNNIPTPVMPFTSFREIPEDRDVTLAATLAFARRRQGYDARGKYAAILMGLVKKGYIRIERITETRDWALNNTHIIIENIFNSEGQIDPSLPKMHASEEGYFNLIRRYAPSGTITMEQFQRSISTDASHTTNFYRWLKQLPKRKGVSFGLFRVENFKKLKWQFAAGFTAFSIIGVIALAANPFVQMSRLDFAFGAFFVLGAGLIGAGFFMRFLSNRLLLLTQQGAEEQSKWEGLYNFLNDETMMNEHSVEHVHLWEEFLVYATAFNIADKVIKSIRHKFPNVPQFQNSRIMGHPFLMTGIFIRSTNRSFASAGRAGGGGFGGGFGGAGRGGGGGGGGH